MDKLKRFVKHLFAPAIVLILVAIMGVFSPVVSVAAALRANVVTAGAGSDSVPYHSAAPVLWGGSHPKLPFQEVQQIYLSL